MSTNKFRNELCYEDFRGNYVFRLTVLCKDLIGVWYFIVKHFAEV